MNDERRGWLLDEAAHAGHEHLDPGYAATYDAKAGLDPVAELALLRRHGLDAGTTLVDLGAGTGLVALAAAPHCRRVVAVDPSPAMVDRVRADAAAAGHENVECVEAGFLTYEHRGDPAQLVHSRNALHHLPDFWKGIALARVAALLPPGGTFLLRDLVFSFEPHEADESVEAWLAGAACSAEQGWTRAELEEHVRGEYSTFSWLLEPLLEHAGFDIREAQHRGHAYSSYVCVRTMKRRPLKKRA
jgi:cyclopropane fatty-acyl-phospholipid synthase-like methyltransferase